MQSIPIFTLKTILFGDNAKEMLIKMNAMYYREIGITLQVEFILLQTSDITFIYNKKFTAWVSLWYAYLLQMI